MGRPDPSDGVEGQRLCHGTDHGIQQVVAWKRVSRCGRSSPSKPRGGRGRFDECAGPHDATLEGRHSIRQGTAAS